MRFAARARILSLPLLLAAALVGCRDSAPVTTAFLEGRFEILRPASWSLLSDLNDAADLQMGNLFREAYCMVLSEARMDFSDDMTLAAFSDRTREILLGSLEDARTEGPETLVLGGQPALRYVLQGSVDRVRIRYWHVAIATPTHFHQVVLWSLPSRFERNRADFEAVLASLRPAA